MRSPLTVCVSVNVTIFLFLAAYFFLIPAGILLHDLRDPGLRSDQVPRFAFRWHRALSPNFQRWATQHAQRGPSAGVNDLGVSGTEWPLFGSVFYLWATESLQKAWDADSTLSKRAPKAYAQQTIRAATALVVDPNQATWVRDYWGDSYLQKENLFYRMMLISAMTSYHRLMDTTDTRYVAALREQVTSLAQELDDAPYGVIDDYPGYCYPVDIVAAIAAIRRADSVLGTDHSDFVKRAVRGFQGSRCHLDTNLPGYLVDSRHGNALDVARGVGLSFMLIWAPEIWPETAAQWYRDYVDHFWQEDRWCAGFREFSRDIPMPWFQLNDPDAGPVIRGYGCAATAFAIAASKVQGRYDHSYALASQALVACWPLPDGSLLAPRFLSNISEAPYLGEAIMTFLFSHPGPKTKTSHASVAVLPWSVYVGLMAYCVVGVYGIYAAWSIWRRWRKHGSTARIRAVSWQLGVWVTLLCGVVVLTYCYHILVGLVPLLGALLFPRYRIDRKPTSRQEFAEPLKRGCGIRRYTRHSLYERMAK